MKRSLFKYNRLIRLDGRRLEEQRARGAVDYFVIIFERLFAVDANALRRRLGLQVERFLHRGVVIHAAN